MRRTAFLLVAAAVLAAPASAFGHGRSPIPPTARMAQAGPLMPCPGAPIRTDRVITGTFSTAEQGSYVLVPFDVPAGTTAVRVKYCYDQPESPLSAQFRHTLDLGLYEPRRAGSEVFGGSEFRGWGGSSHPDVTLSPEGFSSEEAYRDDPKAHVPGKTTRGFLPGPVPGGTWAAELGVAAVVPQTRGDADGRVAWRVEVELSSDPAFADEPYRPAAYDASPAAGRPGWYAGDVHVHAEHSALGDATMRETLDYAFGEGKLDFVTLSDYVGGSGWGEIGRVQPSYPGKLVARSSEVITYRGHLNNHVSARFVDYRTGPLLERRPDGSLVQRRGPQAPRELFDGIHRNGGFTQVNHPTIFPSEVPGFAGLCRGCPWDYSDEETDWSKVDAYEVHTGPPGNDAGPNPFTVTAIQEYDRLRREGHWLAVAAVSDSHNAGRTPNPVTQAPVGTGTTVVYAPELSEDGLWRAVRAGHTYAKVFGPASPDLRLEARNDRGTAIMGDGLEGSRATLTARVLGGDARHRLAVLRDGREIASAPITGPDFRFERAIEGTGDYRLQLMRGAAIEGLTTPIRLGAVRPPIGQRPGGSSGGSGGGPGSRGRRRTALRVTVRPRRAVVFRRTRLRFRVTRAGTRRRPVGGAIVRIGGRRARTNRRGVARMVKRFQRVRRYRGLVLKRGFRPARPRVRVIRRRPTGASLAG